MEESVRKPGIESGDKEILYSKAIKAGKRIYYLDVKKNLKDDLFLAITESKKIQNRETSQMTFEKHKIFLYKEDFDKFLAGMTDVIGYIKRCNEERTEIEESIPNSEELKNNDLQEIKIDIDF